MDLLKKGDIQRYDLSKRLCISRNTIFGEKRFQFLVEWDPNGLIDSQLPT
jgi:hypothetical protein